MMIAFLRHSGLFGLLALLASVILLFRGIYLLRKARFREQWLVFLTLSLLPCLLGLLGTFVGTILIQRLLDMMMFDPKLFEQAVAEVRYPSYMGFGGSAVLLPIAFWGLHSYQSDGANAALGAPRSSS